MVDDDFEENNGNMDIDPEEEKEEIVDTKPNKKPNKPKNQAENQSFNSDNKLCDKFSLSSAYIPSSSRSQKTNKPPNKPVKSFEKENEKRYKWLVNVKDADEIPEGEPGYDPRTLYIPPSAWGKFTAFEKQYWDVKSKMWDSVVFFKKGKFYELYERDADIAHNEFDLKLAGGGRANMRLAGIPEMSFDYWAASFIGKGYKVAKVDQKETALAKEMRENSNGKKEDKVIRRELSCVLTAGTLTDESMLQSDLSTYCISIKESISENKAPIIAACFVDTATGAFSISEFEDNPEYTYFETLIAQLRPREVLLEKNEISSRAVKIIKNNTSVMTLWNYLKPGTEFWDHEVAFEQLVRSKYFPAADLDDLSQWPAVLKEITTKPLAMSAFGGLLWYLKSLKIDENLISLGNFSYHDTIHKTTSLVLDGQTLQNLDIFVNSFDGGDQGTLFRLLNRCITPFGKRQLKNWVCHPLMNIEHINQRLDAVDKLNSDGILTDLFENGLNKLPDLERMLSRIHSGLLKVKDFILVIQGFEKVYGMITDVKNEYPDLDGLLAEVISEIPLTEIDISEWSEAFDRQKALEDNEIVPQEGFDLDYDQSCIKMKEIESELLKLLRQYRREFKSQQIEYKDSGKEIYLIEVPVKLKGIPSNWKQMGATAKVKRYWSPEVSTLVRQILEAREIHKTIYENLKTRVYQRFDKSYDTWLKTTKCISTIDCLLSLARTASSLGSPSCRPKLLPENHKSQISFKELRHPCFNGGLKEFISNDVTLGGKDSAITLLTGANAAGKSTVLRMTCVAVIMAHIGCYIPAEEATLTLVDRIMTRLGANDNIFAGKSTFLVELSETKRMLADATPKSLLVIDELGRGGSSSDGFAIAESVLHHVATQVQSLAFFATHYGTLWSSFTSHPQVRPMRMAILVDEEKRNVTFLYKLEPGVSPGSFGMHVASMCGISKTIVDNAEEAAKNYEHTARMRKLWELTREQKALIPLGLQSDISWLLKDGNATEYFEPTEIMKKEALRSMLVMVGLL